MENQTIFVEKAYEEALDYANETINLSKQIRNNYTKSNEFYYEMKAKDIFIMILYFALSITALILKGKILNYLNEYLLIKFNIELLREYLSRVYTIGCVIVLLIGIWQLFKLLYANKIKAELRELEEVENELDKEKNSMVKTKDIALKAINSFEYVQVGNPNKWEQKINSYREKSNQIGIKTRNIGKWIGIVGSIIAVIIFLILFNHFIVDAISGPYNYCGTLIVCISYMFFILLIHKSQMILVKYVKKWAKHIGIILVVFYQIVLFLQLKLTDAFKPLINLEKFNPDKYPEWMSQIIQFAIRYLINEGVIVIAIISLISIMYLIRTDIEKEYLIKQRGGYDLPLDDGSSTHITVGDKKLTVFAASAFVIIAPFFMSEILRADITFGRIVLYLVLGIIWFGISASFIGDEITEIYGKSLFWVKNAFFFSYMFLTLSMVSGVKMGDVIAILVQSIISAIALVILIGL